MLFIGFMVSVYAFLVKYRTVLFRIFSIKIIHKKIDCRWGKVTYIGAKKGVVEYEYIRIDS